MFHAWQPQTSCWALFAMVAPGNPRGKITSVSRRVVRGTLLPTGLEALSGAPIVHERGSRILRWLDSGRESELRALSGTSFVWFPGDGGSVAVLVIGTAGFGPDAHILGRPGHRRRLQALARLHGNRLWVKPDPLDLNFHDPGFRATELAGDRSGPPSLRPVGPSCHLCSRAYNGWQRGREGT